MGITGLLPFLENATKPCHISEFRGRTVAIDTYCWLHKGANACAFQIASGEYAEGLVNYCLKYIKLLQSFDIKPILVFDGKNLPAKAETESKRRESRHKAKQRASELLTLGRTEEARSYLKQSINITPDMAVSVIKEFQKLQVDCIVAPYESDAQLAFFNLKGVADLIITEDSDLILFGCSRVLYKLDLRGCGYVVDSERIPAAMKMRPDNYTFDKFRYMCILSGCDYVDSLHGIGLKKAEKFIKLTAETNPLIFLDKVPSYLNMRHLEVSSAYKEKFMSADATFRHQTVFDPFKRQLTSLTNPDAYGTLPKYCENAGDMFDHDIAYQVALGNLHPTNLKVLNNWSPTKNKLAKNSIWSGVLQTSGVKKQRQCLFTQKKEPPEMDLSVEVNDEQLQLEADKKIEQEIASYFKKSEKRKMEVDPEDQIENKKKKIASPVLQKNPFLKKLSKFQMTKSDTDVVVKSRYFCSQSEIEKEESKLEIEENIAEIVETDRQASSDTENIPDNSIDSPLEALSKIRLNETVDLTEDVANGSDSEPSLEINSGNISVSQPCSSGGPLDNNSGKRKRLGTCRTLGLKRTRSEGQPTLHDFFSRFQKK